MHIVVAPNAFKNSLDATAVADAIIEGLHQSNPGFTTTSFPVGDGGDGTGALIIQHLKGSKVNAEVKDPLGRRIPSSFGLIDNGKTAVIEMANASGLRLLKPAELDPLHATSFGTGQLIQTCLQKKVEKVILCIGGSATVDGGTGILQALGFRFLDEHKNVIDQLPLNLVKLESIDTSAADQRIKNCEFVILCDVGNKLLGNEGAAAIFGPQKGASPEVVKHLEASLGKLKEVILKETGNDISLVRHGGAAGGVAAGLWGLLHAKLVNGIEYFLSLTRFDDILAKADLVITGEGSIDEQTLQGKGPFGVAESAKKRGLPVIGMAGKIPLKRSAALKKYFDDLISINQGSTDLAGAIRNTRVNLVRTAKMIGDGLNKKQPG